MKLINALLSRLEDDNLPYYHQLSSNPEWLPNIPTRIIAASANNNSDLTAISPCITDGAMKAGFLFKLLDVSFFPNYRAAYSKKSICTEFTLSNGESTLLSSTRTVQNNIILRAGILQANGAMRKGYLASDIIAALIFLIYSINDDIMDCVNEICRGFSGKGIHTANIACAKLTFLLETSLLSKTPLDLSAVDEPLRLRLSDNLCSNTDTLANGSMSFFIGTSKEKFTGKYALSSNRIFTDYEKQLIPVMPESYVLPDFVVKVCQRFQMTSPFPSPMRTAMFIGTSGSGKTDGAKAVCSGCGLPYLHYTCSSSTELFDFLGQVFPVGSEEKLDFEVIRSEKGLPSIEDILNAPEASYLALFGTSPSGLIDPGPLISELIKQVMSNSQEFLSSGFSYIESDFIKAIRNGWGFEIQEVNTIIRASVLTGLNALLESGPNAFLTLPTGELVRRHPDSIVIFTSNDGYEGTRLINQAILSRVSMVFYLDNPSEDIMAERIRKRTGFPDMPVLIRMIHVIQRINDYCRRESISDGVCGMRELECWAMAVITESSSEHFEDEIIAAVAEETVLNKASQDCDDIAKIKTACLDAEFCA